MKKVTSLVLALYFLMFCTMPLGAQTPESTDTLASFLANTDEIRGSYVYPNMIASVNSSKKLVLPAHTPIAIRCEETITTNNIVNGSIVKFSVVRDVKDENGRVLIKAGAPVSAQISFAKDKGMIGRSGEITITDFHTTAIDGTYIPLSGSVSSKADDKMTLSIVLSVIVCPLFLLMKGEEARMPAGTQKTSYTITDAYIAPVGL